MKQYNLFYENEFINRDIQSFNEDLNKISKSIDSVISIESICENTTSDFYDSKDKIDIINSTVESLLKISNIGINIRKIIPDVQNYSSINDYGIATMEGIKQTASKIWKAIVDAFKRAIEWISDVFNRIFSFNKKLSVKIEKQIKEIEEIEVEYEETVITFQDDDLYKKLYCDGSIAELKDIKYSSDIVIKLLNGYITNIDLASSIIDKIKTPEEAYPMASKFINDIAPSDIFKINNNIKYKFTTGKDDVFRITEPLVGNERFYISSKGLSKSNSHKDLIDSYRSLTIGKTTTTDKIELKDMEAMQIRDRVLYLEVIKNLTNTLIDYESKVKSVIKKQKDMLKKLEKALLANSDVMPITDKYHYKKSVGAMMKMITTYTFRIPSLATSYGTNLSKNVSHYVEESENAYKDAIVALQKK